MYRTVASYPDPIEAHIVCGRLRAEGIDALVADDQMSLANWEWRQAIGGTKVRVAEPQFELAKSLIAELDGGGFALDPDTGTAPYRESGSSRLALLCGMLLGLPLPWRRLQMEDRQAEGPEALEA
jgi:Putative prokaryotic signal transducing protein